MRRKRGIEEQLSSFMIACRPDEKEEEEEEEEQEQVEVEEEEEKRRKNVVPGVVYGIPGIPYLY
jgi:hypothetical protein